MTKREKGPFDVAIRAIHFYIAEEPGLDRDRANRAKSKLQRLSNLEAAIRVLEAAGKVDKAEALEALQDARRGLSHDRLDMESIVALIESLPDEEEKL